MVGTAYVVMSGDKTYMYIYTGDLSRPVFATRHNTTSWCVSYELATISRLLKITGHFCKMSSLL